MYVIPYSADFECPKGHKFRARASPFSQDAEARCPHCYEEWVAANVPNGRQVSKATEDDGNNLRVFHD